MCESPAKEQNASAGIHEDHHVISTHSITHVAWKGAAKKGGSVEDTNLAKCHFEAHTLSHGVVDYVEDGRPQSKQCQEKPNVGKHIWVVLQHFREKPTLTAARGVLLDEQASKAQQREDKESHQADRPSIAQA